MGADFVARKQKLLIAQGARIEKAA